MQKNNNRTNKEVKHLFFCTNGHETITKEFTQGQIYEVLRDGYTVTLIK